MKGHDHAIGPEALAGFAQMPSAVFVATNPQCRLKFEPVLPGGNVGRRVDGREVHPEGFARAVAKYPLRAAAPAGDASVLIQRHECVVAGMLDYELSDPARGRG